MTESNKEGWDTQEVVAARMQAAQLKTLENTAVTTDPRYNLTMALVSTLIDRNKLDRDEHVDEVIKRSIEIATKTAEALIDEGC